MSTMHNINNHKCLYGNRLKCDRPALNRVKNILVITELTIATLFARILIMRYRMPTRAFVLT